MFWEVEFTDEFEEWWDRLSESEQGKVDARVRLLMERGPNLKAVPIADRLFEEHLRTIAEGRSDK